MENSRGPMNDGPGLRYGNDAIAPSLLKSLYGVHVFGFRTISVSHVRNRSVVGPSNTIS